MSALGELLILVAYVVLIVTGFILAVKIFTAKKAFAKICFAAGSVFFFMFVLWLIVGTRTARRAAELERAGTYHLTSYPNCNSCKAVLLEDNTYIILNRDSVLAKGDWHFEMGGDYLIIYLNGENDQMGNGDYQYDSFVPMKKLS